MPSPPHPPVPEALLSQAPAQALLALLLQRGQNSAGQNCQSLLNALALLRAELLGARMLMRKKMVAFM